MLVHDGFRFVARTLSGPPGASLTRLAPHVDGASNALGLQHNRPSRRTFLQVGVAAFGGAILPAHARAQQVAAQITTTDLGGATLFVGAGCNVVALAGPDGALMVDGGRAANAETLLAAVTRATGTTRVNTLINTHWHPDQTGANELVGKAGGVIFAHEKTKL